MNLKTKKREERLILIMANRGLKRICASCGIKFYDMDKQPIKCPSCGATFTGDVEVKSRRSRSTIAPDTVKRDEIEAKNKKIASVEDDDEDDDDTLSLDDLDEDDDDDIDDDLRMDDIDEDDENSDDDLSDLEGDIDVSVDVDKD